MPGAPTARLLAVSHLPLVLVAPLFTALAAGGGPGAGAAALVCALVIGAVQLRHSGAAVHGRRPAGWPWTLLAIAALVHVPLVWLPADWSTAQWAIVASLLMLLPSRVAVPAAGLSVLACAVGLLAIGGQAEIRGALSHSVVSVLGGAALLATARLLRARELVDAACGVPAERAAGDAVVDRDARLGQALSAVSFKGDLALRLWPADPAAAVAEVESLTGIARAALRATADAPHHPSRTLDEELDAARRLLAAAGVDTQVRLAPGLARRPVEALARVLHAAVQSVLRCGAATEVTITAEVRDGRQVMEVVSDARVTGAADTLAAGLDPLGGVVVGAELPQGRFLLAVDLPEEVR